MRYVCSCVAMALACSFFAPPAVSQPLNLSVTNYQNVGERRATLNQWYVTFRADLVNSGPALTSITATVASRSNSVQVVAGQGTLHFGPVAANGRVTSADTFTLLVDRSAPFDWSLLEWSFNNPVANAGASQTARLSSSVTLDASASTNPSGVGTLSYNWRFQSVPSGSRAVLQGANTAGASFVVDVPGSYQCQVTVTNGVGTDTAAVVVSTVNSPPIAVAGPNRTVAVGDTVTLNGSRSSDVDGDPLTYSWSFVSSPSRSLAVLLGAQTVLPTFVADASGTYIVQLIVRDGKADSQPSLVTVSTANTPPVANAGAFQTVTAGMFVQLNGSASTDVDGDSLTYRWSFNSLPPGSAAVLSSPTSVNPTFTADKTGTYIVQLVVNDGKVDSPASTVNITTNAVQAPTARAGNDLTVHAGTTVHLTGSGTDPQSFPLTYAWSLPTRPPSSTATLSAGNISDPTFVADLPGIYGAQLVVSNGVLSSSPSTVTITTTNTAPGADPGPPQSVYTGDTVYLDGSRSSDADNDPIVSYSWSFTSKPTSSAAVLSGADTKTPSFLADVAGAYVVQLIVSDKFASSQAKTVLINVGSRTIGFSPNRLSLYNSPGTLNLTLSPTPTSPVSIQLSAETPGIVSFSPNPATVPANSSGVNVTATPLSPGVTNITATAAGYYATSGTVTVTKPTISISLSGGASAIALTHRLGGTITLDAPAPPGGTVVTLSSVASPDGAVTFEANPVTVPEGSTTASLTIVGAQVGAAVVNAVASGYNPGRQTVQVVILGSVSLPTGLTVGSGQSVALNLQLTTPAPSDGLTISLTSSDTQKLTVAPAAVTIRAGATAPETAPRVFGAAQTTGDATVTATAGGFYSDQQTIRVMGSVTFQEQAVSVGPGGVKTFSILLSAPAPAGGLLVYLTSSNESVATVPPSGAIVSAGQQSVESQVSGVSSGSADITLSTNPSIPGNQYFSGAGAVLRVTVSRPTLRITTESLPAGTAGANYPTTTLSASGGVGLGYFWTIPVGTLPSGLSLNTSGVLSGTLSSSATTSTFTVQVQDTGGNRDTKTFTITVTNALVITTESLPAGVAGSSYGPASLTATGGSGGGYSWSLASGALPTGLSLSVGGVISGDLSSTAATSTFAVQVQDSAGNTTVKQLSIAVGARLSIVTSSLPTGTAGALYPSTTLAASGGSGSYTWSLLNSSLPSGLILNAAGVISGTLAGTATTSTFTVQVKDSANNTATKQFTLTVNAALRITNTSLPNGMTGGVYPTTTLNATGGSGSGYTWSVTLGSLPRDLTLSPAGVLSGTLSSSAATSTFTIQVQDNGGATAVAEFTITVNPALSVVTTSLPAGVAGSDYPAKILTAIGGTGIGYTWSISSGSLPSGLQLSTTGVLSGSLASSATTSTFTIEVKDSAGNTAQKQFTLTVNAALQITTSSLPDATAGTAYSPTTLRATGGSGANFAWSITAGSVPAGLALSADGVLSGTAAANAISSTFTVQVRDGSGNTATKQFSITVTLSVTTTSLPAGDAGKSYSTLLTAAGGTGSGYAWSVFAGSLPNGLTLSAAGVLSGTLSSSATTSTFTVQVQDSAHNAGSRQFTLTVNPALSITTQSLPAGTAGAAYSPVTLAASGGSNAGYVWSISVGALPSNLVLSAGGVLSGTLSSSATSATFTVQVQDSAGNVASKQFTLTVETALTVVTASLPDAVLGANYPATTLSAAGGTGTGYSWSITSGSLPAGLNLSADGAISGVVSDTAVTSNFTVQVKDSAQHNATKQLSIVVKPAVTITTTSLPNGMAGSAYTSTTLTATGGSGAGYAWTLSAGALPLGLNLSNGGVISGTLNSLATTATVTVRVQDSGGAAATRQFTITVNPALAITTASLPPGMASANYPSTTLAATGGTSAGYGWSISEGSLPSGLSLGADGVLSGALSNSATTSTFTVKVQDNGSNVATRQFTITVYPRLTITTSALSAGIAGNVYPSVTLAATGGTGSGYSWSVASGTLPAGLTLSGAGLLSGTLSSSATSSNVTIKVQDGGGNTAMQLFTITVNPALSITTESLPNGTAGTAYSPVTLAAAGGSGAGYVWSVSAGSLPSGLTLSAAGQLSGTLSASAATSTFTIQVKDSGNNVATRQFTITVATGLGIFTAVIPAGVAGTAYGPVTLTATGGTGTGYVWSLSAGSLPLGLNLSSGGVISGTLSATATSTTFTVLVKDSANNTATRDFTLIVNPALAITTSTLPAGTAGSVYPDATLTVTGGTGSGYTCTLAAGSLPANLALSQSCTISGTLASSAASSTFTVQAKDSGNNVVSKQFTITVNPAVQITTAALPAGTPGAAYTSTTLAATGGTGSGYTWSVSIGSLPAGLTLSSGGVLSGTPTNAAVTSNFTIQVQDSAGNVGRRQFTVTVTLVVTTSSLPGGTAGTPYAGATLAAAGGTGSGYSWSISSGSLPPNLALSLGGVIAGSLSSAAATSTFTVRVQDSSGTAATKSLTISVGTALTVETSSLPNGTAGSAYPSTNLTASGGSGSGYTWSLTGGLLPSGLTLSSAGVISGTVGASATSSTFTVQVKDSGNNTATRQLTITVNAALAITTVSAPGGVAGAVYSPFTFTASGGTGGGYTWSVTSGSLPSGLTLSSSGVLSGTIGSSATSTTFTLQVKDSGNNTATKDFTLTVNPVLAVVTTSLPAGMAGSPYAGATLAASGGTGAGYTWSVTVGSLPAGLTLSSGGVLSGTLDSAATNATFTVKVQDGGGNTATRQFTISVYPTLTVTTASLPAGMAGTAYAGATLAASGGSGTGYSWSISAGALPGSLTLSSGGAISGTLASSATSATFTVQVRDSAGNTATRQFTLQVYPTLVVTTASLPSGSAGAAYPSTTLEATGGSASGYTWSISVGTLPAGLTSSSAGAISGTLSSSAATSTFTVRVQDSVGNSATRQLTITVTAGLSITTTSLPLGIAGSAYPATTLTASGGTGSGYSWTLAGGTSLPSGLILSSAGVISGTLGASAATATFTVQVTDSGHNTATKDLTLNVNPALAINAQSFPIGVAGTAYPATTLSATGGTGTGYVWSINSGSLPAGLTLSAAGVISGTLDAAATNAGFSVQVQDSDGHTATKLFSITVNPALTITTLTVPTGMAGAAYQSTTLSASGGAGSGYSWSVSAGSLPAGLTLSTVGVLSGTLSSSAATSTFTVQVTDSGNNTATRSYTITVYPALSVTTSSLPGGTGGASYSATTLAATGGSGSGYTWSISAGSLPPGLTLSSAGTISGVLAYTAGPFTFTVQVKDSVNNAATKQLTITVAAAALSITTGSPLPNGEVGTAYSAAILAVGGTTPYTWSASAGLPGGLTLDTSGSVCGSAGTICGTPAAIGSFTFNITVTDNTSPAHQSVTKPFTITVTGSGGLGTITVPDVTVGANLQAPVLITFTPATSVVTVVTITSGNAGLVLLGNSSEGGKSPLNVTLPAGSSTLQFYVKALATGGPVTITVSADSGYNNGTGAVKITNSGFVLAGPNGIGGAFTTYQGVTSGLTAYPYRLDTNNVPVENQPIRGGLTVNPAIAVAPGTLGTMGSPTVPFSGGDQSAAALFTASYTNRGNASVTISPPLGSSFVSPATGATLNVTVESSGFVMPSGITIGRNLQAPVAIGLTGAAGADTVVTITSSDETALKFATSLNGASAKSIQVTIRRGASATPTFYARAYGSSGSVSYTVSASTTYGTVTSAMPLGLSGFVINTPAGQGTNFSVTLGSPDPTLEIITALFDSSGNVIQIQPVAADATVIATVTSFSPSVGTVSTASVQVPGGASSGAFTFHAVSVGSTRITASGSGYTGTSVQANVMNVSLFLNPVGSVGKFLAAPGLVNLSSPATTNVPVTVTVASGDIKLAANKTDAGANSIVVTVVPGSTNATFWVFGMASSGTASYTASALGSTSQADTVTLAPSGVAVYMGAPGNPSCFTNCTISLSGGPKTIYAVTYQLTTDGSNTISGSQPLAGGAALSIPLSNSVPAVGTVPATVSIAGGASSGSFVFTPSATGSTVVSVNLSGWTPPSVFGSDLSRIAFTVQ